jgi:hypothetical protein
MSDELANINGVKPNKLLADGETLEARSESKKRCAFFSTRVSGVEECQLVGIHYQAH